jgi:hypothetical protein
MQGQWLGGWGGEWLGDTAGGGNPVVAAALKVSGTGAAQITAKQVISAALVGVGSSDYLMSAVTVGGEPPVEPHAPTGGGYSRAVPMRKEAKKTRENDEAFLLFVL